MNGGVDARVDETTRRAALVAAMVSSFLSPFMMSCTNVALPAIAAEFRMDAVFMTLVPMVYILPGAIFVLPFGKIADIYGRKSVFVWGIGVFSASTILCGLAGSGPMLILWRILQGLGSAMIYGNGVAILMSVFSPSERGRVLGVTVASVYVGLSIGPPIGGFLTEQLGWRSIFFLCGLFGSVITVWVLRSLKGEWAEAKGERFDILGSAAYCLAFTACMYGLRLLPAKSGFLFIAVGLAGLGLFLAWEARIEHPVLDWKLLRHNRVFALSNVATFINYGCTYAIGFLISLYLQYSRHMGPQAAGMVLISQPVVQAAFSPYAGKLSDRVEPQKVASFGMSLTVTGLILFLFLRESTPLWFVIFTLALHGLGFALFSSPNTNAIMGAVDTRLYGVASGVVSTMRLLGSSFSISVAMLVFSLYVGQVQITPERYHAFLAGVRVIFAVFVVLCFGGIFASLARGKTR